MRLGLAFLALAGAGEGRRGGCARWSSVRALRRSSRSGSPSEACSHVRNEPGVARHYRRARLGAAFVVGAAAPFGEIEASGFKLAIESARALAHSVRLTPWRAFLIAGLDRTAHDRRASRSWD